MNTQNNQYLDDHVGKYRDIKEKHIVTGKQIGRAHV